MSRTQRHDSTQSYSPPSSVGSGSGFTNGRRFTFRYCWSNELEHNAYDILRAACIRCPHAYLVGLSHRDNIPWIVLTVECINFKFGLHHLSPIGLDPPLSILIRHDRPHAATVSDFGTRCAPTLAQSTARDPNSLSSQFAQRSNTDCHTNLAANITKLAHEKEEGI